MGIGEEGFSDEGVVKLIDARSNARGGRGRVVVRARSRVVGAAAE